jgi:indolepyruvate ferredoxin oxidoreductase beta subunit
MTGNTMNVLITGVGGQGTVLAARLIGQAALEQGLAVRGSETIGMAQRGGSVVSHIRLGESASPLILPGEADIVIAFEPGEAARSASFLRPDGVLVVSSRVLVPVAALAATGGAETYRVEPILEWLRANVKRLFIADGEALIAQCGARCLNVALLGLALAATEFPFGPADMERVIRARLPAKYVEQNIIAFHIGMSHCS